jgi:SNF2 family DNA or RNA helicase
LEPCKTLPAGRQGPPHRQEANKVLAINLILEDTIEENMKARIEDKQKLFHAVTGTSLLEA